MASVTGMTAAAMEAIGDGVVVDAHISGDNLILDRFDGGTIDAGNVRGPAGTNGTNGSIGPAGPAGPTSLVNDPIQVATTTPTLTTSGAIPGLARTNVPVTIGHTYGFNVDFDVEWASLDVDAEWHFWLRVNGVNYEKFIPIRPVTVGFSFQKVIGTVFWDAPATASTDDFDVFAQEIVDGANISPSGSSTLKRKFWIVDYGVVA